MAIRVWVSTPEEAPPAATTGETVLSPKAQNLWDKILSALKGPGATSSEQVTPPEEPADTDTESSSSSSPDSSSSSSSSDSSSDSSSSGTSNDSSPPVVPTPSATPALNEARNLTGIWSGKGDYYQLDMVTGERARKITVEVTLTIKQTGTTIEAELFKHVIAQDPAGLIEGKGQEQKKLKDNAINYVIYRYVWEETPAGYSEVERVRLPLSGEGDNFVNFVGTVSGTTLVLKTAPQFDDWENWEFTFTTDLMSGGVKAVPPLNNTPWANSRFYYGHDSDPKAFVLTRQK